MTEKYLGKVKIVEIMGQDRVRIIFTDKITAGDGDKKDILKGKGKLNLDLSHKLMMLIKEVGIPQHTIERDSETSIIARKLTILPVEVVVRNIIAGSFAKRYGQEEGKNLNHPITEFFVKNDELHDPLIDSDVAIIQGIITQRQRDLMRVYSLQINQLMKDYFSKAEMLLVDFKLEFGIDNKGILFLADEISADSMRVWDKKSREKLDKDRFRKNLGDVLQGYRSILERLEKIEYIPSKSSIFAVIKINPKDGVNNPSGEILFRTLNNLGISGVLSVNTGKIIEVEIENTGKLNWIESLDDASIQILSNPMIEKYSIEFRYS